jgi:hypothetical protein
LRCTLDGSNATHAGTWHAGTSMSALANNIYQVNDGIFSWPDRSSPNAGTSPSKIDTVANIRFDKSLNRCWRRFVCCKELMHVFDSESERVSSRDRFLRLMKDIDNRPMAGDQSDMFTSEMNAEWMALIALCPKRLRDKYMQQYVDRTLSPYDVGLMFKIPEAVVKSLMSDYYDAALDRVTK